MARPTSHAAVHALSPSCSRGGNRVLVEFMVIRSHSAEAGASGLQHRICGPEHPRGTLLLVSFPGRRRERLHTVGCIHPSPYLVGVSQRLPEVVLCDGMRFPEFWEMFFLALAKASPEEFKK